MGMQVGLSEEYRTPRGDEVTNRDRAREQGSSTRAKRIKKEVFNSPLNAQRLLTLVRGPSLPTLGSLLSSGHSALRLQ